MKCEEKSSPQVTAKPKQWRGDYLRPTILKQQQGMWGYSCRDQGSAPAVHTYLKPPDIVRGLSLTWNSGKFFCKGLQFTALNSKLEGRPFHRDGHPAPLRHAACEHIKGSSPYPGSGLYPRLMLTFTNLPRGKTGMLWLYCDFKLWFLVCVFLKGSTNCY